MSANTQAPQVIYLYDLPKGEITSATLGETIKTLTGYTLPSSDKPQIQRDPNKNFYSAVVRISDKDRYEEICQKLKYFEIGGKPCRGVPYDAALLGSNRQAFNKTHTAFVAYNNKNLTVHSKELEETFKRFGEIKTAKAAIDSDYKPLGYGFVTFKDQTAAE